MAVVLTLVQIRINISKRNNTKSTVQTIQNTVNTSTRIIKTPTHYKTHTYTHPHITKQDKTTKVQVKTNTLQVIPKWNSHNIIKYPQYKVTTCFNATALSLAEDDAVALKYIGVLTIYKILFIYIYISKGIPRQAEVALWVPGRLRPRIFSTFGTTRMVGRQPNAPAAFTPGEILGTHF